MRRLKGASLIEAVVAAILFLTTFAIVMELLPRLAVRDDDSLLIAEARWCAGCAFDKYGSGVWPVGEYSESYDRGEVAIRIETYRDMADVQLVTISVKIEGSRKRIEHKQLVGCME